NAAIGVRRINESHFETGEVFQVSSISQRSLHYEERVVSRKCEGVRCDTGARFDRIGNRLPQTLQSIGKPEGRVRVSGVGSKSSCIRIADSGRGKGDAVAAVPASG